jgi:hypothetical protein
VNAGRESEGWNRRGEYVHESERRMAGHQMAAAPLAVFALARFRLRECGDMLRS